MRFSCSWTRSSLLIRVWASWPKPVFTPYTCLFCFTTSVTSAQEAATRSRAASLTLTRTGCCQAQRRSERPTGWLSMTRLTARRFPGLPSCVPHWQLEIVFGSGGDCVFVARIGMAHDADRRVIPQDAPDTPLRILAAVAHDDKPRMLGIA